MYVSNHLKLRVAIARLIKQFYHEAGNSSHNRKRIFNAFGKYLGVTYDTFLSYLKKDKYDITGIKLPSYVVATIALLEAIKTACEHLYARRPNAVWTLPEIVAEIHSVLLREAEEKKPVRKIRID